MKGRIFIPVLLFCFICSGCTPSYINDKPSSSIADIIPSTYADTQMKINKSCNSIVVSSSSLQTKVIRYLEETVDISVDDKNSILSDINNLIQSVKTQREHLGGFRPHDSLLARVTEVQTKLNDYESALRALKVSVEENDYTGMVENKNRLKNVDDTLKSLSII